MDKPPIPSHLSECGFPGEQVASVRRTWAYKRGERENTIATINNLDCIVCLFVCLFT